MGHKLICCFVCFFFLKGDWFSEVVFMHIWMVEGLRRGCLLLFFYTLTSKSDVPVSETNISSVFSIGNRNTFSVASAFTVWSVF